MGACEHGSMGAGPRRPSARATLRTGRRGRRCPALPRAHAPSRPGSGFTLVEVILTILVVGVGLVASVRALPILLKVSQASRQGLIAQQLAADLLAEIGMLPFEDPDGSPVFGPDDGEPTGIRAAFDDIDDYHGWTASPPQKKDGSAEPDAAGYTRSVTVQYVDPDTFEPVKDPSDAKQITITVTRPGMATVTITSIRLRGANREDLE